MSIAASSVATPLVLTGPLPAYVGLTPLTARRRVALAEAGWQPGQGVRYFWKTASVVWDGHEKRIWIAAEDEIDPSDWKQVLGVLRMAGWLTGRAGYTDIGEPGWDRVNRVWLWVLTCP